MVQIGAAVGLAPILLGESWEGTPIVGLAASLVVVAGGAAALIGASSVGAALATASDGRAGGS